MGISKDGGAFVWVEEELHFEDACNGVVDEASSLKRCQDIIRKYRREFRSSIRRTLEEVEEYGNKLLQQIKDFRDGKSIPLAEAPMSIGSEHREVTYKIANCVHVVDPGHEYLIRSIDGGPPQRLVFVKREGNKYPGNKGHHGGVLTQFVMHAVLDRLRHCDRQQRAWENDIAIASTEAIIAILEARAKRMHSRLLSKSFILDVVSAPTCDVCGHIECDNPHKADTE